MKNYISLSISLFLSLVAVSCSEDGLSTQNAGKDKPVVTIEQNNAVNYLMTFTLTADFNTAQFGYVILDGSSTLVPAAQDIVMDKIGTALQSGVFNAVDQVKKRVEFECEPNHEYKIYAAAISDTGLLSYLAEKDIKVSDTEIPTIVKSSVSGNTLILEYSEDIVLNKESYATIQYVKWGTMEVTEKQDLPLEYISVEGNVATINCPKPANGAGYLVSFPQGLFLDLSGNKGYGVNSSFNTETNTYKNLGWDDATVDFTVEDSYFKDAPATAWNSGDAALEIVFPFDIYKNTYLKNTVSIVYEDNSGKEYSYADYDVDEDKRTVRIKLPHAPKAIFDVKLERGAVYDEWGNVNSEFELQSDEFRFCALDLKYGKYEIKADKSTFPVTFTKLTASVVTMSADWFNLGHDLLSASGEIMPVLKGVVDYEGRTITFDGSWYYRGNLNSSNAFGLAFYYYGKDESKYMMFWGSGKGSSPIVVSFDESGTITSTTGFDYSVHSSDSSYSYLYTYDEVKDNATFTYMAQ
jgi:hypothetical protein